MSLDISKTRDSYAVIYVTSKKLEVENKLETRQGLRFIIGKIISYKDILSVVDEIMSKEFKSNMLLSTKNITKGLGGQIREMAAITNIFKFVGV